MIRPATMEDLREVVGMGLDHHLAIQGKRLPPADVVAPHIKKFCEDCINGSGTFCAVAQDDGGELVGMMTGFINSGMVYYLPYLVAQEVSTWVKPEARGKGHGKALVQAFYDWAAAHTLKPQMALVGVYQHLAPKQCAAVYRSCGFALESQWFSRRIMPQQKRIRAEARSEQPEVDPCHQ